MVAQKMSLKMTGLRRTNSGYRARKIIPADARTEYKRLFGIGRELKFSLPAKTLLPEAKAKFSEWLSEVEARIEAIRARNRGEAQGLTNKEAAGLVGRWYEWYVKPRESSTGEPERW